MCKLCILVNHIGIEAIFENMTELTLRDLSTLSVTCTTLAEKMNYYMSPVDELLEKIKYEIRPYDYNVYFAMQVWTYQDYKNGEVHEYLNYWLYDEEDE